jgi:SpoVK/Ycf46/Vps4 family AAA+-type ATPase
MDEILLLKAWLKHSRTILQEWGLYRIIKPGYRSLFYGPPGTGKTLTACLIGKSAGLDVYRIDLSMVVSKYIGETEKNLANVFDQAQNKNWILFFDEADALFGKRTQSNSSNDRYANQEVSYLLQRIEDFPGIVILASNLKTNIDEAFARRFQSIIHFPMPDPAERRQLWTNMIPESMKLNEKIVVGEIANEYELSGGAIINVIRHCAIKMLQNDHQHVTNGLLLEGIRKEFMKEGKVLNIN